MDLIVDKQGFLVDKEGNRFKVNEEEVKVSNHMTQEAIDDKVKERLDRQKKEYETTINQLKSQANKTPELEELLKKTEDSYKEVKRQLSEAEENAQSQVAQQMKELKEQKEAAERAKQEVETNWMREQVSNQIMKHTTDPNTGRQLFINASEDVVPRMLQKHKREQLRDENTGKPIEGKFVDLYEVEVKDGETGKVKNQFLPADKAIQAFAANPKNRHYLMGNQSGGPQRSNIGGQSQGLPQNSGGDQSLFGVGNIAAGLREKSAS